MSNKTNLSTEMVKVYTADHKEIGNVLCYPDGSMDFIQSPPVTRNVKDRLFRFIFGNSKHKEWSLALYNAIEGTDYTDVNDLEIVTLENAIYMHMRNDVSLLVGSTSINFFEHQSTLNPNLPYRLIQYWCATMERYMANRITLIYGSKPIKLPNPKFYVFYNGTEKAEKRVVLKLSDLYYNKDEEPALELKVIQFNIKGIDENSGFSRQLYEYEWFVEKIRKNAEKKNIAAAVNLAIDQIPEDFTIRDWILENRSEVVKMSIFEYDEQAHMALVKEEGRQEGIEQGKKEGIEQGREEARIQGIQNLYCWMMEKGNSESTALTETAEIYRTTIDEISRIIAENRKA